jgi:hypothetical protein
LSPNITSKCKNLKNLIVTLLSNHDWIISPGDTGFSLQLNCYPQTTPPAKYKGYTLLWFQYELTVHNEQVLAAIQYWSWLPGYPDNLKGHGYNPPDNWTSFATATSNIVPRGSVMRIELDTDSNDNVTGMYFGITPTDFNSGKRYLYGIAV